MSYIVPLALPKSCSQCPYHVTVFSHPFWSDEKPNRKAYLCQADAERRTIEMDIYDDAAKAEWCPLREYPDQERSKDNA